MDSLTQIKIGISIIILLGVILVAIGIYSVTRDSQNQSNSMNVVVSEAQDINQSPITPTKASKVPPGRRCGMLLDEYCQGKYSRDSFAVLTENSALGWKCESRQIGNRRLVQIDMDDVCRVQHGSGSKATMGDRDDFESWSCSCPKR